MIKNTFEMFKEPILLLDSKDRIIDLNQAAQDLVISPRRKVVGHPLKTIFKSSNSFPIGGVKGAKEQGLSLHLRGKNYLGHIFKVKEIKGVGSAKLMLLENSIKIGDQEELVRNETKIDELEAERKAVIHSITQFDTSGSLEEIYQSLATRIHAIIKSTSVLVFAYNPSLIKESILLAESIDEESSSGEKDPRNSFFIASQLEGESTPCEDFEYISFKLSDPVLSEQFRQLFELTGCISVMNLSIRNRDQGEIIIEIRNSKNEREYSQDEISNCHNLALLAMNAYENLVLSKKLSSAIEERTRLEERSNYDAYHDAITGLPNRVLLMDRLGQALNRFKLEEKNNYAVILLDLDKFKIINDSLGHRAGDILLNAVGQRIRECVRDVDTVARIGGDEFVILLVDIKDVGEAVYTAEKIQQSLTKGFVLGSHEVFTSASIGITMGRITYDNPSDILRDADASMYCAKDIGGGCYAIYDEDMLNQARNLLTTLNDLRRAIRKNEFEIYYQPIISFASQRPVCFEALIRWHHPERGLVNPDEFIHLAEEHGLIGEIGEIVLRSACKQLKSWQEKFPQDPPLAVSVNISAKQLEDARLIEVVREVIEENNPAPGSLILEITESSIIRETESALFIITQLKLLGVKLYLDDFGIGYSSLNILHKFPIDNIKLDRLFVARMTEDQKDIEIVRTIVELGIQLDKTVVAEGIESPEQKRMLQELNCNFGQGFYFSVPVKSAIISQFLTGATCFA